MARRRKRDKKEEVLPPEEEETGDGIADIDASVDEITTEDTSEITPPGEAESGLGGNGAVGDEPDPLDIMSQKERDEALNASA